MDYNKEEMLDLYERMAKGRSFALQMKEAVNKGYCRIAFHTPWGEEAVGVGIAAAMTDKEWYAGTHRSQNTYMQIFDHFEFISEIFCRKTGVRKGVTFDAHINDMKKKVLTQVALIGAQGPIYTGFAWALKHSGKDEAVVIEMGDGAASEGATYEAWNLAQLYKVPVCYVVVNNQWAMSVYQPDETPNPDISEKAKGIGLHTQIVDGNDVLAVKAAVEKGIALAHQNIPNVVELKTLRWGPHLIGQREYVRPDAEKLAAAMVNDDPVKRFANYLLVNGYTDEAWNTETNERVDKEIYDVIEKAGAQEFASFDEIYGKNMIYGTPETGGDL